MARTKQTKRKPREQRDGKGKWKGAKRRREEAGREKDGKQGEGYPDLVRENALFEKYYKGQGLIPDGEWDRFLSTMKENLPATFRITGTKALAENVLACLEHKYFRELHSLEVDDEKIPPPQPLPWYPERLAWHVPLSRTFIRKSPLLSKFHSFLVKESEQGNISRQEAVSMVPPLLLGVEPHHKVLDMCAAPGSKTAQLIEALHAQDTPSHPIPDGVVIANDADNKRCYMLVHQAKRLNSPCLMVTNHDASVFPVLYHHNESGVRLPLHYDRVLCDVPCSGDGTLRKNPIIWHSWNPTLGTALHRLQLRIITKGLELLAPGGQLVYSTCSLNPVEDEAVIATMLSLSKGTVELVDCSDRLPELKRSPGVSTWRVMLKNGEWVESLEKTPPSRRNQLQVSMFPSHDSDHIHLERCMRILPHHQDTGGFFVALLRKNQWLPWQRQARERETANQAKAGTAGETDDQMGGSGIVSPPTELLGQLDTGTCPPLDACHRFDTCGDGDEGSTMPCGQGRDDMEATVGNGEKVPEVSGDEVSKDDKDRSQATDNMEVDRPSVDILGRPGCSKQQTSGYKEDPFVFFDHSSEICCQIRDHFGFPPSFPSEQLLSRTWTGKKRNLYLTSHLVKELTLRNEKDVKIIAIGVRVLSRCHHVQSACDFRLTQDGIDGMVPFVSRRVLALTTSDAIRVLKEANPLTTSLSLSTQQALASTDIGPALFVCKPEGKPEGECAGQSVPLKSPIHLSGWVAAKSVRLFVAHQERYHFLAMLGVDPPEKQNLETISGSILQPKEEDERISEEETEERPGDQLLLPQEGGHADQHESNQGGPPLATHVDCMDEPLEKEK